ncbi:MAG TPA: hypothetical protein VFX59_03420 [Polyangiales bacterium]|nr:hypothetical protein [Polyangiales bacterium]
MIAFVLNLDAELELADARHRSSPAMLARIAALRSRVAFLAADDRVIGADDASACTRAVAYCPTPSALARIRAAGLPVPAAPSWQVLRTVNARSFCAALGQTLPGARYVRSMDELRAAPRPATMLLKRDFGFAGRERRPLRDGRLDAPSEGFARRSFARGEGLQLEPWLAVELELSQHGYLTPSGGLLLAEPRLQRCDAQGSWLGSESLPAGTLRAEEAAALAESTQRVAAALREARYFGPFGIDAFRYAGGFQPRSELNARLSMGYPRELLRRALTVDL